MTDSVLRTILKAQGRKRPLTLRPIIPTRAEERELYRAYMTVVDVWVKGLPSIMDEYARTRATYTGDSIFDMEVIIEAISDGAVRAVAAARGLFSSWATRSLRRHADKLGAQLTYATGIQGSTPIGPAGQTAEDFVARNTALVRNVSDQIRGRISDIVLRGVQERTPIRDVAKEISKATGLGRARSLRIASDQTAKLSAALDELRGRELGFDGYIWRHSEKVNFRPEHKARNGQFFAFGSHVDVTDPPGQAPFCGCKRQLSMEV